MDRKVKFQVVVVLSGQPSHPIYTDISTRYHETVAVGTILTDRPPHRSAQARLRMRLL